jgi:hypothetical protein
MNLDHPGRSKFQTLLLLCAAMAISACVDSTSVRGPYLQNPSSSSIVIKWRNSDSDTSEVRYGTSPGELFELVSLKSDSFDHEVVLENLLPETRYYYRVNGGIEGEYSFKTPPVEGVARPTRVWVLGDAGTADTNSRAVRDAFYKYNNGIASDLVVMLGDNAYQNGTDSDYQAAFFEIFPSTIASTPVVSTIGNHEVRADQGAPYFDIFDLPSDDRSGGVPSGTEAY